MTVQDLIDELNQYSDKNREVMGFQRGYHSAIEMEFGCSSESENGKVYLEMYDTGYAPGDI